MSRRFLPLAVTAACALLVAAVATDARADTPPSVWDRAKDPTLSESYRLHVEVERRLSVSGRDPFGVGDAQARAVRTLLERYNAAESKDARLRFDLGFVYERLEEWDKAAKVLTSALDAFPDHAAADAGWSALSSACGHTGDHDCERKAYLHVLGRATEDADRGTPTLNLAETEMHLGNLREAVLGYREALRLASRSIGSGELAPLAEWGLAVALDRSGDRPAAEKEARFAIDLERSMNAQNMLRGRGVYFVPAWEIHWYEGLGAIARARQATAPAEIVRLWRAAEQSFTSYVRFGEPAKDRWVELAKLRLASVKSEREKAEKKYGKTPAHEADDEEREIGVP